MTSLHVIFLPSLYKEHGLQKQQLMDEFQQGSRSLFKEHQASRTLQMAPLVVSGCVLRGSVAE